MAKKFVIVKKRVIMSAVVDFHRQLVSTNEQKNIHGGGWWHYDKEKNELTFYAKSEDFGQFTKEDLIECIQNDGIPNFYYQNSTKIFHSQLSLLSGALENREELKW